MILIYRDLFVNQTQNLLTYTDWTDFLVTPKPVNLDILNNINIIV